MSLSDPTSSVSTRRNNVSLALAFVMVQPMVVLLASSSMSAYLRPWFAATAVPLAAEGLALVLWRSRPLVCQALVWPAEVVTLPLLPVTYITSGYGQFVVPFGIGMRFLLRRTVLLLAVPSLAYSVVDIWRRSSEPQQLYMAEALVTLAICLVPILSGAALVNSRRYEHSRRELLRREHGQQLEVALIQERCRFAGELHDVVAHHLARIAVQAAALERPIDRNPQTAREAAQQLRRQAKETLSGLRSVVSLLRSNEEVEESSPGLRGLSGPVAFTRALGVGIELFDGGLPGDEPGDGTTHSTSSGVSSGDIAVRMPVLSQWADTAIFRVVQQSISNTLQHAPGAPTTVELRGTEDPLESTVLNGPAHRPSTNLGGDGMGLTVIRERADAVGDSLHAGPVEGGDWWVRLVLPLAGRRMRDRGGTGG